MKRSPPISRAAWLVLAAGLFGLSAPARASPPSIAEVASPPRPAPIPAVRPDDTARFLAWAAALEVPTDRPERGAEYRLSAEIHQDLAGLIERWPDAVSAIDVGDSVKGRDLWGVRIGYGDAPPERRILVIAQLHALEWIAAETALAYATSLVEWPPGDLPITRPHGIEVVVIPICNPDGRLKAEADLMAGRGRTYRRANANLEDLNRDWAVNRDATALWRHLLPRYYYTSEGPLSQPETQAIDALVGGEFDGRGFDAVVSLHAFGGWIYLPWSGRWPRPDTHGDDDFDEMMRLGRLMADAQPGRPYKVAQLSRRPFFFFRAQGTELDHFYGVHGSWSFLIELTRSGIEPRRPETWRDYFRWYNPRDPAPHVEMGVAALLALSRELSRQALEAPDAPR